MRIRKLAIVGALLVLHGIGTSAEPTEWEQLVGRWKVVERAGKLDYPWDYINKNGWVVIAKDKATLLIKEGDKEMKLAEFNVKLDATAKPKKVELTVTYIAPEGEKAKEKGTKLAGIYELKDDTIKLLIGDAKDPPKAFPDKDEGVSMLKREKAK